MSESPAPRTPRYTRAIARGLILVFAGMAVAWSLVYWLLALLRRGSEPPAAGFLPGLVTAMVALALFAGVQVLVGIYGARRAPNFKTLSDAMRRIAGGDFTVTVPVKDNGTNPLGTVATNLNLMAGALQRMETMRQEFISDVSHEIQSPLTSIAGFARALQDDSLAPEQRRSYLTIIEEESKRLSRLSDGLLKLTTLEARVQPIDARPYRLDAQLRGILLASEPHWSEKRLRVDADLDVSAIEGDELMLGQVWSNLFHNAVKFTPPGGKIRVSLRSNRERTTVSIADNGIGIAADDLPFVFDRFFKADKSRSGKESGSGLGLAIARKIVTLHGGTISAASTGPGRGATFSVALQRGGLPPTAT